MEDTPKVEVECDNKGCMWHDLIQHCKCPTTVTIEMTPAKDDDWHEYDKYKCLSAHEYDKYKCLSARYW